MHQKESKTDGKIFRLFVYQPNSQNYSNVNGKKASAQPGQWKRPNIHATKLKLGQSYHILELINLSTNHILTPTN